MDCIVGHYFLVMEKLGEAIEGLENELLNHPAPELLPKLHRVTQELLVLRKSGPKMQQELLPHH